MKISPAALLPLSITVVVLAVAATTSPALRCYVYSEDIIQYWLAWLSLTSQPQLVAEHFSKPWFQCSNMGLFYRPLVQMSYITDTLLYGRNTVGFHLTNFSCHILSSVMCLLITRHLLIKMRRTVDTIEATFTGLIGGLLFGLNPLQLEPVYWLCCRCDGLCTMLSLTSIYLALVSPGQKNIAASRLLQALSVVAWLLALLAKEQAALVPIVLVVYHWMYPPLVGQSGDQAAPVESNLRTRVAVALRFAWPYMLLLVLYSVVRLKVLGGIGGYHGTIGFLLNESLFDRFFSPTAWSKLFYPLDQESFVDLPACPMLYSIAYGLMALASFNGWKANTFDALRLRLIKFLAIAAFSVQVAAYQSFIITESLFGSRCVYMAQAFIGMAMAVVFMCFRPQRLRNILIPSYLALLACTHIVNGSAWYWRGENLKAFQAGVNEWVKRVPPERKFCLLNMPLDARECSSLYDLEQLRCLLKPPIDTVDNAARAVQTTYLRMAEDSINRTRMKTLVFNKDIDFALSSVALKVPFALMDRGALQKHFDPIDESVSTFPAKKPDWAKSDPRTAGFELDLTQTAVPQRADIIAVTVAAKEGEQPPAADLSHVPVVRASPMQRHAKGKKVFFQWYSDLTVVEPYQNSKESQFIDDGQTRTYIFAMGDRTSWKYAGVIYHAVFANLPLRYKIVDVRLLDEAAFVPSLTAVSAPQEKNDNLEADGFLAVNDKQSTSLNWDASRVTGAASSELQISLPDFMYSLHSGSYREFDRENHSLKTIKCASLSGTAKLTRGDFPRVGKYQARLFAVGKDGQVTGFCSDPVDLMVSDKPFADQLDKAIFNLRAQPEP
jgi:hypothetical protein